MNNSDITVYGPVQSEFDGVFKYASALSRSLNAKYHSYSIDLSSTPGGTFIHNISNSNLLHFQLQAYENNPGIVILHDLEFTHFNLDLEISGIYRTALQYSKNFDNINMSNSDYFLKKICEFFPVIVVHTRQAKNFLKNLGCDEDSIHIIDHPDIHNLTFNKSLVRPTNSKFILGIFGHLSENKDYHQLFEFLTEKKFNDEVEVLFVTPGYSPIEKRISKSAQRNQISVKFLKGPNDNNFLSAMMLVNAAYQIRSPWRGEASGVVSQLYHLGVPTITNIDMYPYLEIFNINENQGFEQLSKLISTNKTGEKLVESNITRQHYSISSWAMNLINLIKVFDDTCKKLTWKISNNEPIEMVEIIWNKFAGNSRKLIYSDVGQLWIEEQVSGIQRSTLNIHKNLANILGDGCFFPFTFEITNKMKSSNLAKSQDILLDFPLGSPKPGDTLLLLQTNYHLIKSKTELQRLSLKGVRIVSQVHDILPITHPQYFGLDFNENTFKHWLRLICEVSDIVFTSTQHGRSQLQNWIKENDLNCNVEVVNLASFIENDRLQQSTNRNHREFLVLGTIEPRKGHDDILDAFEKVWAQNESAKLHIVGNIGWNMDHFVSRMNRHPQLNRNLYYWGRLDDSQVQKLLFSCTALIMGSRGEGFGLPIVEALGSGTPVIARDIEVFRELCQDNAAYFTDVAELSSIILDFAQIKFESNKWQSRSWSDVASEITEFL